MNRLALERVLADFPVDGIFKEERLFQVKRYDNACYTLVIAVPGPCGDQMPNPTLKFTYHNNQIAYISYMDFGLSPVISLQAETGNLAFFREKMASLLPQFLALMSEKES